MPLFQKVCAHTYALDYVNVATLAPKSIWIFGYWSTKIIQLSEMGERQVRHEPRLTHD